jgi:hypothetical protein
MRLAPERLQVRPHAQKRGTPNEDHGQEEAGGAVQRSARLLPPALRKVGGHVSPYAGIVGVRKQPENGRRPAINSILKVQGSFQPRRGVGVCSDPGMSLGAAPQPHLTVPSRRCGHDDRY